MKKKLLRLLLVCFIVTISMFQTHAQTKIPIMVNHLAVYVKSLQISTAFYQNVIGLDSIPEPFHDNRHTWFRIGEHSQLHLIQGAADIVPHEKNGHLCFAVPSVDDFAKKLSDAGVRYENWAGQANAITTRIDGIRQIYLQDPDNYWIEINDDKY